MRGVLAGLLAVHGIIHLLGFLKAWQFAEIPQLTGATLFALPESFAKAIGLLWLAAFLAWRVRLKLIKTIPVAGRDTYIDGRGRMVIKLGSVVSVVDSADEKIDQGALLRFLGEIVWFPAAATSPYIHWEPVDMKSARATMTHRGVSGSALFSFDDHGRFIGLTADRYFGGGPDAKIERWEIKATKWKNVAGCVVPVQGEVRWKLATGDFTFYRWELTKLEYDPPGLFSE